MIWNWQQAEWPNFSYESKALEAFEASFLRESGLLLGSYRHICEADQQTLMIESMSNEAMKTAEIEGEYLNRDSLRSSMRRHFGFAAETRKIPPAERGMAAMSTDLYRTFAAPLTHKSLWDWHEHLMSGRDDIEVKGHYRTHEEPMQIVSGPFSKRKVHFEAPPSQSVHREMSAFLKWFNLTGPKGKAPLPALARAGIAHMYFVSIHPFEDGNGRIARALAEKALSQNLGQPTLIALSQTIQSHKKRYYDQLELNNKDGEITDWLSYFAQTILAAQKTTQQAIDFLIEKTKFYDRFKGQFNERQAKVIARLFEEGPAGFKGGLSAENYIKITGTSRATATRDLQALVEKGALVQKGERKGTRYEVRVGIFGI